LVHFSALTTAQQHHIYQLDHFHEPTTYKEAAKHPHWAKAMEAEIDALKNKILGLRLIYLLGRELLALNGSSRSS